MFDQRDVIVVVHVTIERSLGMRASMFNVQTGIHVKHGLKLRKHEAKRVKPRRELLSRSQKLPRLAENVLRLDLDIPATVRDIHERVGAETETLTTDDLALIRRNTDIIRALEVSREP